MTKTWLYPAETMLKTCISAENSIFFHLYLMIISFKGYDDSGGLHINHMDENRPNRTYFH